MNHITIIDEGKIIIPDPNLVILEITYNTIESLADGNYLIFFNDKKMICKPSKLIMQCASFDLNYSSWYFKELSDIEQVPSGETKSYYFRLLCYKSSEQYKCVLLRPFVKNKIYMPLNDFNEMKSEYDNDNDFKKDLLIRIKNMMHIYN